MCKKLLAVSSTIILVVVQYALFWSVNLHMQELTVGASPAILYPESANDWDWISFLGVPIMFALTWTPTLFIILIVKAAVKDD